MLLRELCFILKKSPTNKGTLISFGGVEYYNFRKIALSLPVRAGYGSFFGFWKRYRSSPDNFIYSISEDFDKLDYVVVHAGGKRTSEKLDSSLLPEYNEEFFDFCLSSSDYVNYYGVYDTVGKNFSAKNYRDLLLKSLNLGIKTMPTVRSLKDLEDGFILSNFDIVGIGEGVSYRDTVAIYGACKNAGVKVHLFAITSTQTLRNFSIYSASTYNWLGGRWYGNTYYFDNFKLRVHPTSRMRKIRNSMYPICQKYGLDHAKILTDINEKTPFHVLREIDKLNIASFLEYEKSLQNKVGYWYGR